MKNETEPRRGKIYEEKGLPVMKKVPPMPKYPPQPPKNQKPTQTQQQPTKA